jgi:hypothetical protein
MHGINNINPVNTAKMKFSYEEIAGRRERDGEEKARQKKREIE